eukprot:CAMPEP_0116541356 /NCGR_PEP_ID=MMETSP0397-20121206/439_1 /TAXON_ID=216820 /ORGANISM="Cyclophora tenuis, Strain ECT3854" /LENGTH=98 /DNA_ID=CAMNT_0004065293 /DNA_START=41 /DNA_END=337 /DNA_ORIENTATION=-
MVASRAIARSRVLLARKDVSPHMVKWWNKVRPDDGQVVRSLSPFEQHAIMPWIKTFPKKLVERAPMYFFNVVLPLSIAYGMIGACGAAEEAEIMKHRF